MIHLKFEDVRHTGSGRYDIDWDNGERKYKTPFRGINVYECGIVEVTCSGYNDPHWRRHTANSYDLRMESLSEFGGYKFFTPEGQPVQKNQLTSGSMFMHDYERGRIYRMPKWRGCITFLSEHAQPIPKDPVKPFVRDRRKERDTYNELVEHHALGTTLLGLQGAHVPKFGYNSYYVDKRIAALVSKKGGDLSNEEVQNQCKTIAQFPVAYQRAVIQACGKFEEYQYLNVKEK